MAYFPLVGRLACDSHSTEHRGFWQLDGYGILSIYKQTGTDLVVSGTLLHT